ncbi:acetyl-CoA synthetase [Halobellus rubicundus]|uniref:Acetyl-CoA synthetase n=1 Tax=Halobellus rubicundus TaxID=2996466 RepID=A0ABD5MEF4_9EURY
MTAHPDGNGTDDFPAPPSDPATIGDLVARDRRTSGTALRAEGPGRTYSYRDFVTTSYKSGNVLRYLGVRADDEVLVVPDALPEPVLAFYGAAQLGAVTRFADATDGTDDPPRAILAPVDREADFDLPPGHRLAVHGGPPDAPATTHWESEVWSENPAVHPASVDSQDPVLVADGRTYSHRDLLAAAETVVAEADLRPGTDVVVDGPFADPLVVASGLVAPILAGATVVLPDEGDDSADADASAVTTGELREHLVFSSNGNHDRA